MLGVLVNDYVVLSENIIRWLIIISLKQIVAFFGSNAILKHRM